MRGEWREITLHSPLSHSPLTNQQSPSTNQKRISKKYLADCKKVPTFATAKRKHRGVEQLVARQAHNLEVACSSPASATTEARNNFGLLSFCCVCLFICSQLQLPRVLISPPLSATIRRLPIRFAETEGILLRPFMRTGVTPTGRRTAFDIGLLDRLNLYQAD